MYLSLSELCCGRLDPSIHRFGWSHPYTLFHVVIFVLTLCSMKKSLFPKKEHHQHYHIIN